MTDPSPVRQHTAGLGALIGLITLLLLAMLYMGTLNRNEGASKGTLEPATILNPVATGMPPAPTPAALAQAVERPRTRSLPFWTPTPMAGGQIIAVQPTARQMVWWTEDGGGGQLGDSFLYAGLADGRAFVSALLIDLHTLPRNASIDAVLLRLTGLNQERLAPTGSGVWSIDLLALEPDDRFAQLGYTDLRSADVAAPFLPSLTSPDLGDGLTNILQLEPAGRALLADWIAAGRESAMVRIMGPTEGPDALFAWDSGFGASTAGAPPGLLVSFGPAEPVPTPRLVNLQRLVPSMVTPDNMLTAVAVAVTATRQAQLLATQTLPPAAAANQQPAPAVGTPLSHQELASRDPAETPAPVPLLTAVAETSQEMNRHAGSPTPRPPTR